MRLRKYAFIVMLAGTVLMPNIHDARAATTEKPVVLELFTSQGCSSCPPADALLKRLAADDSSLLPLSFHVHYWDYLGWKDPFASPANTKRQQAYAAILSGDEIYTPQLIVGGQISVVGSDAQRVTKVISIMKKTPTVMDVAIVPAKTGNGLTAVLDGHDHVVTNGDADIWAIYFNRTSTTNVAAGENEGREIENINNVTSMEHLGMWKPGRDPITVPINIMPDEGLAVIVQAPQQGHILGSAVYYKPHVVER